VKTLGIIPARGGSKSIPKKNIQPLHGKPLIAYTIEQGLHSKYIDRLIVSTEDEEIAQISRGYGAEVPFMRPVELATDTAPTLGVIIHAVEWLIAHEGYRSERVVILQANSPLMKSKDIDRTIEKHITSQADVVYTVAPVAHPAQWLQTLDGDRPHFIMAEEDIGSFDSRQGLPPIYRSTGTISVVGTNYLLRHKENGIRLCLPKTGQKSRVVVLDPISSLDIDTWLDLYLAETIIAKRYKLTQNI